jgi:hypothetical protein
VTLPMINRYLIISLLLTLSASAQGSMRCGSGIVSGGETTSEVIEKCGKPSESSVINPVIGENGYPKRGSVTIEHWVYGPANGGYRYLKFIDGKLVGIEFKRK